MSMLFYAQWIYLWQESDKKVTKFGAGFVSFSRELGNQFFNLWTIETYWNMVFQQLEKNRLLDGAESILKWSFTCWIRVFKKKKKKKK